MTHLIIVSVLFLLLTCYVSFRVLQYLSQSRKVFWLLVLIYFVFSQNFLFYAIVYKAGFLDQIPTWISLTLSVGQAFCILLAILSFVREALLILWFSFGRPFFRPLLRDAASARKSWLGWMKKLSLALCIGALILTVYGVRNALKIPEVKRVEIVSPSLPVQLDGLTIAQLSDLHISLASDPAWLNEVVKETNNLHADIIVITGDMLDGNAMELQKELAPLNDLRAPYGVFVITGNHEYYVNFQAWLDYMRTISKHTLILNGGKVLDVKGVKLGVAGVSDEAAKETDKGWDLPDLDKAFASVQGADYKILLRHRPKTAKKAAKAGFNLQLSGHTHGGQFFPGNLLVAIPNKFSSGLYSVKGMDLYVNPGSSLWGRVPLRIGVDSEITLIVLKRGS